jgi:hypothetical protein
MGILFIFTGGVLGYFGYKLKNARPKYQFERTTSGRTVKFLDYRETKNHDRNKIIGILVISIGIMLLGIGLIAMLFKIVHP